MSLGIPCVFYSLMTTIFPIIIFPFHSNILVLVCIPSYASSICLHFSHNHLFSEQSAFCARVSCMYVLILSYAPWVCPHIFYSPLFRPLSLFRYFALIDASHSYPIPLWRLHIYWFLVLIHSPFISNNINSLCPRRRPRKYALITPTLTSFILSETQNPNVTLSGSQTLLSHYQKPKPYCHTIRNPKPYGHTIDLCIRQYERIVWTYNTIQDLEHWKLSSINMTKNISWNFDSSPNISVSFQW